MKLELSRQWSGDEFAGTLGMASISVAIVALMTQNLDLFKQTFLRDRPHANKPLLNYAEFYPFYLKEHSDSTNRLLHFIGTSLILGLCLLFSPRTAASIGFVFPIALAVFYSTVAQEKGLLEFAVLIGSFITINRIATGRFRGALGVGLLGYGFAWYGHFFHQHNKPATFIYPTFSLMSDFKMWYDLASGAIQF